MKTTPENGDIQKNKSNNSKKGIVAFYGHIYTFY